MVSHPLFTFIRRQFPDQQSFLDLAFNPNADQTTVNTVAQQVLPQLYESSQEPDQKRYAFNTTHREQALRLMFKICDKQFSPLLIHNAELNQSWSFYPRWKSAVYITLPRLISKAIDNVVTKVALTVSILVYPIFKLTVWLKPYDLYPLFTALVFSLLFAPALVFSSKNGVNNDFFACRVCSNLGAFFQDIATRAELERTATQRNKTHQIWESLIRLPAPSSVPSSAWSLSFVTRLFST